MKTVIVPYRNIHIRVEDRAPVKGMYGFNPENNAVLKYVGQENFYAVTGQSMGLLEGVDILPLPDVIDIDAVAHQLWKEKWSKTNMFDFVTGFKEAISYALNQKLSAAEIISLHF